jgi:lysine biosynthesis protein LysW
MIACTCPHCNAVIELEDMPCIETRLACRGCGDVLKVVSVAPLKLEWALDDLLEDPEHSVRMLRHPKIHWF